MVAGPIRKRGRPKSGALADAITPALSRDQILDRATTLAQIEPLGEISMVGLARELGVTPASIYYYIGSRNDLISGVVNRYFKKRFSRQQALTGVWHEDLKREAMLSFDLGLEYGGVMRYIMSHNRFRLFQKVSAGEIDYGILYLDRMAGILSGAGFSRSHAALCYHLLSQYVTSSCYAEITRQLPAFHERYILEQIAAQPVEQLPGAHYIGEAFSKLDSAASFPQGLGLLIESFKSLLDSPGQTNRT